MKAYQKLRSLFFQSVRVWKILRKPSAEEYKTVAKVSLLGVLALGLIGFIISNALKILA